MPKFTSKDKHLMAKGGRNGALPAEVKEARKHRRGDIELTLQKFMTMTTDELNRYQRNPQATAFEKLILKIILEAWKKGDHYRTQFLLDNWVGPVAKKVDMDMAVSAHKSIVDQLEEDD